MHTKNTTSGSRLLSAYSFIQLVSFSLSVANPSLVIRIPEVDFGWFLQGSPETPIKYEKAEFCQVSAFLFWPGSAGGPYFVVPDKSWFWSDDSFRCGRWLILLLLRIERIPGPVQKHHPSAVVCPPTVSSFTTVRIHNFSLFSWANNILILVATGD